MKSRWAWILLGLIIVIGAGAYLLNKGKAPTKAEKPVIRVAMNLPLTGSFAVYGQAIRDGALLAAQDVNQPPGNTKRVKLDIEDNTGSTSGTISVFRKQELTGFDVYSSGVKPQTMAIFDRVLQTGKPYFVWVFDAFITDKNPTVFRTWVDYKYEPQKYLQYIHYRHAKKVAIACVNLPHSLEEFNKILIPELEREGIQTKIEVYDFDTKQYRDVLSKLSEFHPDLYILNGFQENLVGFVRGLRTLGLFSDGNAIGTYDLLDAAKELGKDELEGFRVIAPAFNFEETPQVKRWKQRFQAKFGRTPLYTDAYSYDMVQVIAAAGAKLGPHATSQDWLTALHQTDLRGITGQLAFDKGGDLKLDLRIGVYRNGKLVVDESDKK